MIEETDRWGAVFKPVEGARYPVYSVGSKHSKVKDVMFTCPVSAIPFGVMRLLDLWLSCSKVNTLPKAGGFLDQPLSVRRSFPIFSALYQGAHQIHEDQRQGQMVAAMFGGAKAKGPKRGRGRR